MRKTFRQAILLWLRQNFPQYHNKFRVELERAKYNKKHDPYINAQDKGKIPDVLEIYFENEFVCDVNEHMSRRQVWINVMAGLQQIKADRESEVMRSANS